MRLTTVLFNFCLPFYEMFNYNTNKFTESAFHIKQHIATYIYIYVAFITMNNYRFITYTIT